MRVGGQRSQICAPLHCLINSSSLVLLPFSRHLWQPVSLNQTQMLPEYTCSEHTKFKEHKFWTYFLFIPVGFHIPALLHVCMWCNSYCEHLCHHTRCVCWLSQTCLATSGMLFYDVLFLPAEHVSTSVSSLSTSLSKSVSVRVTVRPHASLSIPTLLQLFHPHAVHTLPSII